MSEEMKEADMIITYIQGSSLLKCRMPQPHIDEIKSDHQLEGKAVVFNL